MIDLFNHKMKVISSNPVFRLGKFTLLMANIAYDRFDGKRAEFKWLIFDRGDSVAVLLHRLADNKVCLVEQFRPATLVSYGKLTTEGGGILEVIAGTLANNEEPVNCLHREVGEEVGRLIKNVRLVTTAFMSPGATSEKISIYLADDDGDAELPGGGLEEEGENIRIHWVALTEAKKMIENGEIQDIKTILAIQALLLEKK